MKCKRVSLLSVLWLPLEVADVSVGAVRSQRKKKRRSFFLSSILRYGGPGCWQAIPFFCGLFWQQKGKPNQMKAISFWDLIISHKHRPEYGRTTRRT
jgi:hypothetical protein